MEEEGENKTEKEKRKEKGAFPSDGDELNKHLAAHDKIDCPCRL